MTTLAADTRQTAPEKDGQLERFAADFGRLYEEHLSLQSAHPEAGPNDAEQLRQLAHHDELTGLAKRSLFYERLQSVIDSRRDEKGWMACFFIDLDRFKSVNDTLGHAAGDQFLKETARRLSGAVRASDTVARLGGDEFAVLAPGIEREGDAEVIAAKILGSLAPAVQMGGIETGISASIGISLFPRDGTTLEQIVGHADMAMYQAKDRGNSYCFYDEEMGDQARTRRALEAGLRKALADGEFRLVYQPIVSAGGGIEAVEALLRWRSPELGEVPPDRFIPVAEDMGVIEAIGDWVLDAACRQQVAWRAAFDRPPRMAVNASPRQISDPAFAAKVAGVIADTGILPQDLEIEVTEGPLMEQFSYAFSNLDRLDALGVGVSIDDFGTGHSSLHRLRALPVKTLKIDRSFVRDLPHDADASAIVTAIHSMAASLGLDTIAEGVETTEHERALIAESCTMMQGYLFAKPSSAQEIERMLSDSPWKTE